MSRAATKERDASTDAIAVDADTVYDGRGGRRVRVRRVAIEEYPPRAIVVEVVASAACAHETLRALNGGACPVCPAPAPATKGAPFEVALTYRQNAWRMPEWYAAQEGSP